MATLFALVYPDQATAEETLTIAKGLESAGYMRILEQAVITKNEDGKIERKDQSNPVRGGVIGGLVLGGLTGLIFTIPVVGLAAGALLGGWVGKMRKSGASSDFDKFRNDVSNELQPNGSALLLLAASDAQDRVVHELSKQGGKLFSTDLSDQQIADLQMELDKATAQMTEAPASDLTSAG
jgi:uncharacterized membrane protein